MKISSKTEKKTKVLYTFRHEIPNSPWILRDKTMGGKLIYVEIIVF